MTVAAVASTEVAALKSTVREVQSEGVAGEKVAAGLEPPGVPSSST